jgi:NMD protein affecting ribosome stability and mRNA decay
MCCENCSNYRKRSGWIEYSYCVLKDEEFRLDELSDQLDHHHAMERQYILREERNRAILNSFTGEFFY